MLATILSHKLGFADGTVMISRGTLYLAQVHGIGMTHPEEQQQRERIERHKEDMIKQIATSSYYTAQAWRAMQLRRPQ